MLKNMKNLFFALAFIFLLAFNNESPRRPHVHIVRMEGMKFIPSVIRVAPGDTVKWINTTNTYHNVVAKDKSFSSDMLGTDQQFEHVFTKTGSYAYFCKPHRMMGMKGVVEVISKDNATLKR